MKTAAWAIAAASLILLLALLTGTLGIHYPRVVEDEPLHDPIEVIRVEGDKLYLSDSRVVEIHSTTDGMLADIVAESNFFVDIEEVDSAVILYGRRDGWVCGTPWAQLIRIPLIPDTVYQNRREMIAFGELASTK